MKRQFAALFRLAIYLICFYTAACTATGVAPRRPGVFREHLSREIERMLREHERIKRQREETQLNAQPRPALRRLPGLMIPVAGVRPDDLRDSFGDPRGGGRHHEGIDIFAPRGSEVIAAAPGRIELLSYRPLGGRSLWLRGAEGRSYFYAHLDRWAAGIYEGMPVGQGDLLGYVGTTGNAAGSSPHLHFEVRENGDPINPYMLLLSNAMYEPAPSATSSSLA